MANINKKTVCPITRTQFRKLAKALRVTINDQTKEAEPKEFSTGSLGWYLSDRVTVMIDGKKCTVMVGLNLTIIGSKEADEG